MSSISVVARPDAVRLAIDAQAAELDARRGLLLALRAPQDRLHAQEQLAHAEGLDDVVVGAELEADHAIDLLALGREHDDLRVAGRAGRS